MGRNYPQYLQAKCDRLQLVVKYQWIAIAVLTIVATWAIVTNNILYIGGYS